jgi:hypothetical protein
MKRSLRQTFVSAVAMVLMQTTADAVPIWNEVADAEGLNDPQQLVGGPYDVIAGDVGQPGDDEDAYVFHWLAGGDFSAIDTAPQLPFGVILIALYSYADGSIGDQLTAFQDSKVGIAVADLLAGDYLLHVTFDNDGNDPPYFIELSGMIRAIEVPVSVPEPGSLMLVAAGVLVLFATHLRKARLRLQ